MKHPKLGDSLGPKHLSLNSVKMTYDDLSYFKDLKLQENDTGHSLVLGHFGVHVQPRNIGIKSSDRKFPGRS